MEGFNFWGLPCLESNISTLILGKLPSGSIAIKSLKTGTDAALTLSESGSFTQIGTLSTMGISLKTAAVLSSV